jgi:hypothetical protein
MLQLCKILAAITMNLITPGRLTHTPIDHDWLDTVVTDLECDAAPDCEIVVTMEGESYYGSNFDARLNAAYEQGLREGYDTARREMQIKGHHKNH